MKLNKSILGIALMLVFLLGACSQAKYSNLTRRTKATHLVKKEVNKTPQVSQGAVENNIEPILVDAALNDDVEKIVINSTPDVAKGDEEVNTIKSSKKYSKVTDSKAFELAGPLQKRAVKKLLSKMDEKDATVQPNEVNDDSNLLRIILIVILVLLILSLIGKILPSSLNWLVGVLLLIVLIWLILQYI